MRALEQENEAAPSLPGMFVRDIESRAARIRMKLDAVDGILQEALRGLSSVPKRGAEVGGILLGQTHREDGILVVDVNGFEAVPIEYRHGPSFQLSDNDVPAFEQAVFRTREGADLLPIGYFRTNTRDPAEIRDEDRALIRHYLPGANTIVLLIRPYATRVSQAGVYLPENGRFAPGPPVFTFPFRSKELQAGTTASASAATFVPREPAAGEPEAGPALEPVHGRPELSRDNEPPPSDFPAHNTIFRPAPVSARGSRFSRWVMLLAALVLLGIGGVAGYLAGFTLHPEAAQGNTDAYQLGLSLELTGDNLHLQWNRQAPAVAAARRGLLTIEDGDYRKAVELDASQLHSGSVVYRRFSSRVHFRLEVFPRERNSVAELLDWNQ